MSGNNNPLAAIFPHLKKPFAGGGGVPVPPKPGPFKKEGAAASEENANAVTHPATSNNVDYTILIAIFVVAGILFLALLIWAIYSTQAKLPMGGEHAHHHHHQQEQEQQVVHHHRTSSNSSNRKRGRRSRR